MTWQIWFACAAIVLAVVGLVKRYETRMVLLLAGFAMCIVGGDPMKAFQAFVKGMTNITLVPAICSAMGFAAVVTASKCDEHLVAAVAAPLKKLGGLLIQLPRFSPLPSISPSCRLPVRLQPPARLSSLSLSALASVRQPQQRPSAAARWRASAEPWLRA